MDTQTRLTHLAAFMRQQNREKLERRAHRVAHIAAFMRR